MLDAPWPTRVEKLRIFLDNKYKLGSAHPLMLR